MRYITILLLLVSCEDLPGTWKTYEIKEGAHYSSNRPLYSTTKKGIMKFQAKFSSSCLYSFEGMGIDSLDINKLYGFTDCSSTVHQNSIRFGWRHDGKGKIEIFAYWYRDGVRGFEKLGETTPDTIDEYELRAVDNYYFRFNSTEFSTTRSKTCSGTRTRDFPYFGGNQTAPNTMEIYIYEEI